MVMDLVPRPVGAARRILVALPLMNPLREPNHSPLFEISDPLAPVALLGIVRKRFEIIAGQVGAVPTVLKMLVDAALCYLTITPKGIPCRLNAAWAVHPLPIVAVAAIDPAPAGEILWVHRAFSQCRGQQQALPTSVSRVALCARDGSGESRRPDGHRASL
jgi:hypothetical protein